MGNISRGYKRKNPVMHFKDFLICLMLQHSNISLIAYNCNKLALILRIMSYKL